MEIDNYSLDLWLSSDLMVDTKRLELGISNRDL